MIRIDHVLRGIPLKSNARYPGLLPEDLRAFYCYPLDSGHSVLVLPAQFQNARGGVEQYLVPIPVRTTLRLGWMMKRGVPVVDVNYDPALGVVVPEEDEEW